MCKQKMIVATTTVLHNYICAHTSGDINFEQVKHDEDYEPTILEK
jgi:hypothetical protein